MRLLTSIHTTDMNEAVAEIPLFTEKDKARFWAKVNKNGPTQPHMEGPCWLWTAGKVSGYGSFRIKRKMLKSHRISWVLYNGQMPHDCSYHGICVCHRCDTPACVNPNHLFIGTQTDNIFDKEIKRRGKHPLGESHGSAKLTSSQIPEIRAIYATGVSQCDIAARFGVSQVLVSAIIRRKIWDHIP
jgi:hypothetical protein